MKLRRSTFCIASLVHVSCSGAQEPRQVELPVIADPSKLGPVTTDLGYEVELTEAKMVVEDLTFAIAGELLTRNVLRKLWDWTVPSAHAHPGHNSGGDITGELKGHFVLDWLGNEQEPLGMAALLEGSYTSANLSFSKLKSGDQLGTTVEMIGYSVQLSGVAAKDGELMQFTALVELDGENLLGIPFEAEIKESSTESLHLQLKTLDDLEGDTLFDNLDFQALDENGDGRVRIVTDGNSKLELDAYITLSRALQTHDNYQIIAK